MNTYIVHTKAHSPRLTVKEASIVTGIPERTLRDRIINGSLDYFISCKTKYLSIDTVDKLCNAASKVKNKLK